MSVVQVNLGRDSLAGDAVKSAGLVLHISIEIRPEFHQEKGVLRTFIVKVFKATFFLGKFVIDLSDVNSLQGEIMLGKCQPILGFKKYLYVICNTQ